MLRIDGPWDGIATLTLDRPERKNALSVELRDRLSDVLDALAADEAVRVVVLTGAGDVFSAGFDLKEFEQADRATPAFGERLWASSDRYHRTVLEFPLPIVAAVNGPAIAGGFDLAVMCDIRVASRHRDVLAPRGDVRRRRLLAAPRSRRRARSRATSASPAARSTRRRRSRSGSCQRVVPPERLAEVAARGRGPDRPRPRELLLRTKAKALRRAGITVGGTLDL